VSPEPVSVGDHDWCTAFEIGLVALDSMTHCRSSGSAVCATLMTPWADEGDPTMNGRSASLPAEATTTMPARTRLSDANDESSWSWPYDEPSDMLTTSTASEMSPSPFGSRAQSRPCSMATPLHAVDTAEQTFTAYSATPGAMPLCVPSAEWPPMMSPTCVPWPPSGPLSIGFGSGARAEFGHPSPTKSKPPFTFGASGPNRSAQSPVGAAAAPAMHASVTDWSPGPPRLTCV